MAYFQTENLWVNQLDDGVADMVLDVPGDNINLLRPAVWDDLHRALDQIEKDAQFRLMVLRTGKLASFCHGIDLRFLATLAKADDFLALSRRGQDLCERLENSALPALALISGGCFSEGLEIALACDYRVAVVKPSTQLGFLQGELGLLPAWGGTQRVVRHVGLERGLQMLLGSKRLTAAEALAWGLVDELAHAGDPSPPAFIANPVTRRLGRFPWRTTRQKLLESNRLGRWLIFRGTERLLRRRLPDDMPAPWACLDAVRAGLRHGVEAANEVEQTSMAALSKSEAFHNLLRLQLARAGIRRWHSGAAAETSPRRIAVLGATEIGTEVIQLAVRHGYQVLIRETNELALGLASFQMLAHFQQQAARGLVSEEEMQRYLGNIRGTTAWRDFESQEIVLDASILKPETRRQLYVEMEPHITPQTIIASLIPGQRVVDLRDGLEHPQRTAALHFSDRTPLVEVALADRTDTEVRDRLVHFVGSLGRTPCVVPDLPGLLVQRLLFPYWNESVILIREGFQPFRIDETMERFGMARGPLRQLDDLGLPAVQRLGLDLESSLNSRLSVDPAFAWMVENQWHGRATRLGFYRYRGRKQSAHAALVSQLRAASHVAAPHQMDAVSIADQRLLVRERLVWLLVNEAAYCVAEGRAPSPEKLDAAMVEAGWAPHRGGPFHYARHVGIDAAWGALQKLASQHGVRYEPCPQLKELVGRLAG